MTPIICTKVVVVWFKVSNYETNLNTVYVEETGDLGVYQNVSIV